MTAVAILMDCMLEEKTSKSFLTKRKTATKIIIVNYKGSEEEEYIFSARQRVDPAKEFAVL